MGTTSITLKDAASQAREKAVCLGRTAAEKFNENRGAAARGLESAASRLHEKADGLPGGEKVNRLLHTAADRLSSTAEYVRLHNVDGMMADVSRLIKSNPGPSLAAAAVVGFLVGRTFSREE